MINNLSCSHCDHCLKILQFLYLHHFFELSRQGIFFLIFKVLEQRTEVVKKLFRPIPNLDILANSSNRKQ